MESPLDLLTRAAGIVSATTTTTTTTTTKRKLDDDEQPLDFSCKKKCSPTQQPTPTLPTDHRPSVILYAKNQEAAQKSRRKAVKKPLRHSSSSSDTSTNPTASTKFVKRKRKLKGVGGSRTEVEKTRRIVVITSKEDDIDAHFRRSLGQDYDKLEEVSVDDHFAKALGADWQIVKKKE